MKMNNFDKELEQALCEYVQNTEVTTNEKITFSKKHKEKMEKLFEDVRNSNFEKGNIDETKGNSYHFNVRIFARVAVFIILGLLITMAVMPSMVAWRTDKLGLYGEESGEYAWILPNDIADVLENKAVKIGIEQLTFFGFLPEGSRVSEFFYTNNSYYIKIEINEKYVSLNISQDINRAVDMENVENKDLIINGNNVIYLCKNGLNAYVWWHDSLTYSLCGDLNKNDMVKIIENINYIEFEKFYKNL